MRGFTIDIKLTNGARLSFWIYNQRANKPIEITLQSFCSWEKINWKRIFSIKFDQGKSESKEDLEGNLKKG